MENLTPIQIAFFVWILIVAISLVCTIYIVQNKGKKRTFWGEVFFTLSAMTALCGWIAAWYGMFALAVSGTLS